MLVYSNVLYLSLVFIVTVICKRTYIHRNYFCSYSVYSYRQLPSVKKIKKTGLLDKEDKYNIPLNKGNLGYWPFFLTDVKNQVIPGTSIQCLHKVTF
jgi:hypothetical protein